jgi:hypothetical protein
MSELPCEMTVFILILHLSQFLKLSYKCRIHRIKVNRRIILTFYQQQHYFDFLTTAFTLQQQLQQSLTIYRKSTQKATLNQWANFLNQRNISVVLNTFEDTNIVSYIV